LGGLLNDIIVNFTCTYKLNGISSSDLELPSPAIIRIPAGQSEVATELPISQSAFLSLGAVFEAVITGVQLAQGMSSIISSEWAHQSHLADHSSQLGAVLVLEMLVLQVV